MNILIQKYTYNERYLDIYNLNNPSAQIIKFGV